MDFASFSDGTTLDTSANREPAFTVAAPEAVGTAIAPANMGSIDIAEDARIAVSGSGAGRIVIEGGEVRIDDAGILADTMGADNAGYIQMRVQALNIEGTGRISASSLQRGAGHAGHITIDAEAHVQMSDQGQIQSVTDTAGAAGNITIRAQGLIVADNTRIETTALENSTNRAGDITITAREIDINNGGLIAASQLQGDQRGDAGKITITADRLHIGGFSDSGDRQRSRITSSTAGRGDAGSITLRTEQLIIGEGGRIAMRTAARSNQQDVTPGGNAGRIDIIASDMVIDGGEVLSTTEGPGQGGDISITAGNLALTAGGAIAVSSSNAGDAGSIQIAATGTLYGENGAITTESAQANGGNITLNAHRIFLMHSTVTAEAMGAAPGSSDGGNVTVQGEQVVFNQSRVQANAFGGSGCNIEIGATDVYLASVDTLLDASSALGLPGTVEIASPVADLNGRRHPLACNL